MSIARTWKRVFGFSIIGAIGFIVDAGILTVLAGRFGWNPYVARAPAFLMAVTTTWALNRCFIFHDAASMHRVREWQRYALVNGVGAVANLVIYTGLLVLFPVILALPVLALAIASACTLFLNFELSRRLVFLHSTNDAR